MGFIQHDDSILQELVQDIKSSDCRSLNDGLQLLEHWTPKITPPLYLLMRWNTAEVVKRVRQITRKEPNQQPCAAGGSEERTVRNV